MKFPGVRCYGQTWVVNKDVWNLKFVRSLTDDVHSDMRGLTDPSVYTMYIRLKQSRKELFQTFIHEVAHAIEFSYDLEPQEKPKYTYKDYHEYIYRMEECWSEFLADNFPSFSCLMLGIPLTKKES